MMIESVVMWWTVLLVPRKTVANGICLGGGGGEKKARGVRSKGGVRERYLAVLKNIVSRSQKKRSPVKMDKSSKQCSQRKDDTWGAGFSGKKKMWEKSPESRTVGRPVYKPSNLGANIWAQKSIQKKGDVLENQREVERPDIALVPPRAPQAVSTGGKKTQKGRIVVKGKRRGGL